MIKMWMDVEPAFAAWCEERGVKPTRRQHAKWEREKDAAEIAKRRAVFEELRAVQQKLASVGDRLKKVLR